MTAIATRPMEDQAGWFTYVRVNGKLSYQKYGIEGDRSSKDTKEYFAVFEVWKTPLTREEYDHLSLDQLAERYPLPDALRNSHDNQRGN